MLPSRCAAGPVPSRLWARLGVAAGRSRARPLCPGRSQLLCASNLQTHRRQGALATALGVPHPPPSWASPPCRAPPCAGLGVQNVPGFCLGVHIKVNKQVNSHRQSPMCCLVMSFNHFLSVRFSHKDDKLFEQRVTFCIVPSSRCSVVPEVLIPDHALDLEPDDFFCTGPNCRGDSDDESVCTGARGEP